MEIGGAFDPGSPGIPTGAAGFGAGTGGNYGMGSMGGLASGIGSLPPSGPMEEPVESSEARVRGDIGDAESFGTIGMGDMDDQNEGNAILARDLVQELREIKAEETKDSVMEEPGEEIFEPRSQPGDSGGEEEVLGLPDFAQSIPHSTLVDPVLNVLGDVHAKGIHVVHAETITYRADDVGGSGPVAGTLQRITRIDDVGKGEPVVRQEIFPESSPQRIQF